MEGENRDWQHLLEQQLGVSDNNVGNRLKAIKKLWFSREGWTALWEINWLDVTEYIEKINIQKLLHHRDPFTWKHWRLGEHQLEPSSYTLPWIPDLGISWHTVGLGVGTGENADSLYFLRNPPLCTNSGLLTLKHVTKGRAIPHSAVGWSPLECCMQWNSIFPHFLRSILK